MIKGI